MNGLTIRTAMGTDTGKRRRDNQDNGLNADGVYMVCDGMGGGVGGQEASAAAVRNLKSLTGLPTRSRGSIQRALTMAQYEVCALGGELGGMAGTTATGLVLPAPYSSERFDANERWYVVNVGDSRTYHMDLSTGGVAVADSFRHVTHDHSQRQEVIDSGLLTPEMANATIPRNVITQAIGSPDGIEPDFYAVDPRGRFIICSDGLYTEVSDSSIAAIAAANPAPQAAVSSLIEAALKAGGHDNVTVLIVDAMLEGSNAALVSPAPHWTSDKLGDGEDLTTIGEDTIEGLRHVDECRESVGLRD